MQRVLFGKWRLQGEGINDAIRQWEREGLDKRGVAARLIKYQTAALRWENEYKQLCVEARRTYRREGLIPQTPSEWEDMYQQLEPSAFFRDYVEPTWPDFDARRAMAYYAIGMKILDETEAEIRHLAAIQTPKF